MRPLDPDPMQDDMAPVSAVSDPRGFWDHLGATRAEEYQREEILDICPQIVQPDPAAEPEIAPLQLTSANRLRLEDALRIVPEDDHSSAGFASLDAPYAGVGQALGQSASMTAALDLPARFDTAPEDVLRPLTARANASQAARPARNLRAQRLAYRLQRIWLTPFYRRMLQFGLPACVVLMVGGLFFADPQNREMLSGKADAIYGAVVDRPEFLVTDLKLPDLSPELINAIRARIEPELPQSSFRLDLEELRHRVELLDSVRVANLQLQANGVLSVAISERVPAILWRNTQGLEVLDIEGKRVAIAPSRDIRPDLPLIAGEGAQHHVVEALELLDAATPLGARVLGLIRVGERRWDVILDTEQRIKLPEKGAAAALERVIALEQAQDMLSRDIVAADFRNPSRPILQVSADAMEILRSIRLQYKE